MGDLGRARDSSWRESAESSVVKRWRSVGVKEEGSRKTWMRSVEREGSRRMLMAVRRERRSSLYFIEITPSLEGEY